MTVNLNKTLNGVGGYVQQLKRLVIRVHPTHPNSYHIRKYISDELPALSKSNPSVSVYVQSNEDRLPMVRFYFLNGKEEESRVDDWGETKVREHVNKYTAYSGEIQKGRKVKQNVAHPSIQGMWTPYTNTPQPDLSSPLSLQEKKQNYRGRLCAAEIGKYRGHHKENRKNKSVEWFR